MINRIRHAEADFHRESEIDHMFDGISMCTLRYRYLYSV